MAVDQTANFVRINVDGTHTDTDTTIQLETGEASELPDPANGEYNLTWWDDTFADHPSDDDNVEIVRVTGVDTGNDTITVQRGQEDTTAVAHDNSQAQYRMVLSATAGLFDQFEDVTNLDGSAGANGEVLKSDGTDLFFGTDKSGMTTTERQTFNDVIATLARNQFVDNLAELAYDGGFFEIFGDTNEIAEQSNVTVSTLSGGDSNGVISLTRPSSTATRPSDSSTWGGSGYGLTINPNQDLGRIDVEISSNTTNVIELTIYLESDGSTVATKQVDSLGAGDVVTFNRSFSSGTGYIISISGANEVGNFSPPSFPYTSDLVDITAGSLDNETRTNEVSGIKNVEGFGDYKASGYIRSTQFDLADDGFTSAPTSVVTSQSLIDQLEASEDVQYVLEGGSGGTFTITQSDVDTEVDISGSISSTQIQVKTELSGDGSSTPELDDEMFHFKE